MTHDDISSLLGAWPYEAGRINARMIMGLDGTKKLQIRIDLGVLQMELTGRPDGQRPEGFESLLEYQVDRLARYRAQNKRVLGFVLSSDECRFLREEAMQYYHRYVGLFSLAEYAAVVRDASRNLRLFDLCRDHGASEYDRSVLEQFRPAVIMMRTRSEAEMSISAKNTNAAVAALDRGLEELRAFYEDLGRDDDVATSNEVQLLLGMREALVPKLPASQRVELLDRLRAAIEAENYELAAILRDELRMMKD